MKEKIIEILTSATKKMSVYEIRDELKLENIDELSKTLDELVDEYKVYKTGNKKYMLFSKNDFFRVGILSMNKKGFGFVISEDPNRKDVFINGSSLNKATDGDKVLISVEPKDNSGKVLKILSRDLDCLIGEIVFEHHKAYLKLDDEKKKMKILVKGSKLDDVVEGTKVKVKITKEKTNSTFIANIEKIIGHKNDPHVDVLSVALKYDFDPTFPLDVEEQIDKIETEVDEKELVGRRDLTGEMIFTIDGDDTKDIDDAISVSKHDGIYTLGVHIADVSHYVTEGSPLDNEAYKRGTSAYLADSVIPMLPHKLSNGICSLNPGVIRLSESCIMDINTKGEIIRHEIFPSYIKSNIQMTYNKVNNIINNNIIAEGYEPYVDSLKLMQELAHILRKNKETRGYLAFDIPEAKAICDENGKCIDIKKRLQDEGECLIEDFMIAANECVATHLRNLNVPSIYRIHEKPDPDKVNEFIAYAVPLGLKLTEPLAEYTPRKIQSLLNEVNELENSEVLSELLLRSMRKAIYSTDNVGHFGLGSECYTHFTSPIRRYPDLTIHRLLRKYVFENNKNTSGMQEKMAATAENSSLREQASIEAEREVLSMKMAEYMESHIGEEYEGVISGLTNFGMFIALPNLIEGLVHLNNLTDDYYNYDEKNMSMTGERKGKRYHLGDKVKIKVIGATKSNGQIDFMIIE